MKLIKNYHFVSFMKKSKLLLKFQLSFFRPKFFIVLYLMTECSEKGWVQLSTNFQGYAFVRI